MRSIQRTLRNIPESLYQLFSSSNAGARYDHTFDNHSEVLGIVDASPSFVHHVRQPNEELSDEPSRDRPGKARELDESSGGRNLIAPSTINSRHDWPDSVAHAKIYSILCDDHRRISRQLG
jgi:hypothetical protein